MTRRKFIASSALLWTGAIYVPRARAFPVPFSFQQNPAVAAASSDITSGLLARWKCNDASGTTVVDDIGGNNGTLTSSGQWTTGQDGVSGHGLSFNGTTQSMTAGVITALSGLTQATMSTWLWRASTSDTVEAGTFNSGYRFSVLWYSDNNIYVQVENAGSTSYQYFASSATGWHHLVVVYDGTQGTSNARISFYLDGVKLTLTNFTGTIPTSLASGANNPAFKMGVDFSATNRFWGGRVDDTRYYNRLLSGAEITTLFNNGAQ